MLTTTFIAPKPLAETLLALTEQHPEMTLDVGECEAHYDSHFTYTLWLPAGLETTLQEVAGQPLSFTPVDDTIDYVAQTKALFPPLAIGPYVVARNGEPTPPGAIGLNIAPNRAFGSGEHATTTGCLLAYEWLLTQGHAFASGLDFGAGSGILAIAAAKRHSTPFIAVDNDAPSVEICAENAALNGVRSLITSHLGEVPPQGPFPLIFANILLQPLLELAPALVQALATSEGSALILSGFTTAQAPQLEERYRSLGLHPIWQHAEQDWLAQVWQR